MTLKEKIIKSPLTSIKNINLTIHNKDIVHILFKDIIKSEHLRKLFLDNLAFFIYIQPFSTTDPRIYVHKYN